MTDESAPPPLLRLVEVLLFVGGAPLTAPRACEAIRGLTPEQFAELIAELEKQYRNQNRPYRVGRQGEGYELALRPGFTTVRDRLFGTQKETRLSQPMLDTLSLVAYRQPITRQEVDAQRGGDSLGLLRQLLRLGLIAVSRVEGSKETHYATTTRFLKMFSLKNLEDLPRTKET
jgi:segregation and condensation protein B